MNEQVNILVQKLDQEIKELQNRLDALIDLRKNVMESQNLVDESKTISYQLGYILIHQSKSFKGMLSIPNKLYRLFLENKKRKVNKNIKFNVSSQKLSHTSSNILISNKEQFNKGLTLLDPISELCWSDTFISFPLARHNFEEQINISTAQFAFFESAWHANKDKWIYAFTSPNLQHPNAQALLKAINLLKQRKIPIIFWNKEDPMHYKMFKPIAKYADYIFTTDSLIVNKYKQELNNTNVFALPFAAPVSKTNPLGRFSLETETVCFAGTYYANNHADRKKQMDMLLPALLDNNGCIYDRASKEKKEGYSYPDIYKKIIRDGVNFDEMIKLYKKFKVFLNVNTITQSNTMMSRRVYELLASGTPVVSTPSKAILEQFPGIVITVNNQEEAKYAVKKLLTDSYYWHKQSMLGIREVMAKHTYHQRWKSIKEAVTGTNSVKEKMDNVDIKNIRIIAVYYGYIPLGLFLESLVNQKNVNIKEIVLLISEKMIVDKDIIREFNVNLKYVRDFKSTSFVNVNKDIQYTVFTNDKHYNFKNSFWGMLLAFKYSDALGIIRSTYYKHSLLKNNFDFSISKENWYSYFQEITPSVFAIKDSNISNFVIDFFKNKIKTVSNKKEILMVDPFNIVQFDNPDELADLHDFKSFIYRVSPYLGV